MRISLRILAIGAGGLTAGLALIGVLAHTPNPSQRWFILGAFVFFLSFSLVIIYRHWNGYLAIVAFLGFLLTGTPLILDMTFGHSSLRPSVGIFALYYQWSHTTILSIRISLLDSWLLQRSFDQNSWRHGGNRLAMKEDAKKIALALTRPEVHSLFGTPYSVKSGDGGFPFCGEKADAEFFFVGSFFGTTAPVFLCFIYADNRVVSAEEAFRVWYF